MRPFLLQQPIERAAALHPDALALRSAAAQLTYAQLECRSRRLALELRARACAEGARIGIWAAKSIPAVVAQLAVLRAGGIYVPLDPSAPSARVESLAADCRLHRLLADAPRLDLARAWRQPPPLAPLAELASPPCHDPLPPPRRTSADLAYILYTSGSTGVPKGVMLTHGHALNFIEWAADQINLGPADRVASHAPFHFDLSIFDLWASLSRGAAVCLLDAVTARFPSAVADWIENERISVWYSVPSALVALQDFAPRLGQSRLRALIFAGEAFPLPSLRAWRQALPNLPLHNWYGPTETNVCTHFALPPGQPIPDPLPIGRACPDFELALRDEHGHPVPDGTAGLLFVRGPGILAGYWGKPALLDPWYNTGDWVRALPDGDLVYEGRRDHMVKCRGYRVSLLEVEQALETCPGVLQAAAVPVPDALQTRALHAFVVGNRPDLSEAALRQHLARVLPAYMIPARIALVPSLPVTATGKLDRQRLPAILDAAVAGTPA